ncbi:putative calcium-binding protein CML25 [Drosera capensis]
MEGLKSLLGRKKSRNAAATASSSAAISHSHSRRSDRFNAQIIEELEQVFKKFDVNGDGKICSSELGSIMRSLGDDLTESELKIMIDEVDSDGDGFIDLKEFIELNTKGIDADDFEQNLREAFSVYDIDGNGSISAEELQQVLRSLGDNCSIAECRRMIGGVDADGDGTICFEEFKVMMMVGSRLNNNNNNNNAIKNKNTG